MADSTQTIRIFISSPWDVAEERDGARRVIEGMQRLYPGTTLQPVLWEELALPATASFQETIDFLLEREPIDIAVFILWSRLGSPLGVSITRPDGTPYRSGTEREFDLMLAAFEKSGRKRPVILAYVRDDYEAFTRKLNEFPEAELSEVVEQRKLAEAFILEQFHDAEGRNLRAYQTYSEPVGFVQRLRVHLRSAIDDLLGADRAANWTEEPYRGLEVFDVHHAPIFHGRDEEIYELHERRRDQEKSGCAFVVIVGASGSGKSSLARAGVAASLIQNAGDDGVTGQWRVSSFVPTLAEQGLCGALVRSIAESLPELSDSEGTLDDISAGLAENALLTVKLSLSPAFASASEQAGGRVQWLLILDQLEELWTDRNITQEDRESFFAAVETLARCGNVSVLATLRSDFYHHAQRMETFLRIKGERGQFDLLPPNSVSVHRLITEPARLAGLQFERNEQSGRSLDEVILDDASQNADALPLLEYTLSELYRQRDEDRRLLTYATYTELGGVDGAIGKRAEETFLDLPTDSRSALDEILPLLVSVDVAGEQSAVRRRAKIADLESTPARKTLTNSLTENRFLTTDREGDSPIASLAHEAMLRRWDRIANWITANREQLQVRARVEQSQQRWEQKDREETLLLAEGVPLDEGRKLLDEAVYLLSESTADYIQISMAHHQRRRIQSHRLKRIVAAVLVVLLAAITIGAFVMRGQRQREVTESLVAAVTTARGNAFPPTVADLDELPRQMVLEQLIARFESADGNEKLPLAFALARYGDVRLEFLISQVENARVDEFQIFVDALRHNKKDAQQAIIAAASSLQESSIPELRHKARLAMLALYLGELLLAADMCQLRADPIQRTTFIDEFSKWHGDLSVVAKHVTKIDDTSFRSGVTLAVGRVPIANVADTDRAVWQPILSKWYTTEPDTVTHSAADWVLRQWNLKLPKAVAPKRTIKNNNWRINSIGMTMLQIPAGSFVRKDVNFASVKDAVEETVTITRPFLLADREVTRLHFQQFLDTPSLSDRERPKDWPGATEGRSPTMGHPVQTVSWYDAVRFCNWLSSREGLTPCYKRTGDKEKDRYGKLTDYDSWRLDEQADGYRLPTGAEWEYACRAGTTTDFAFGDDEEWLDAYAITHASRTEPCGSKLPNSWGFFDMHGNVAEWCNDTYGSEQSGRTVRGGSFYGGGAYCMSSISAVFHPANRQSIVGFRVAAFPSSVPSKQPKGESENYVNP